MNETSARAHLVGIVRETLERSPFGKHPAEMPATTETFDSVIDLPGNETRLRSHFSLHQFPADEFIGVPVGPRQEFFRAALDVGRNCDHDRAKP